MAIADPIRRPDPPMNLEAEQELLGVLICKNEWIDKVGFLDAHHFSEPVHGRIYDKIVELVKEKHAASPATLAPYFKDDFDLAEVGGKKYIARLASALWKRRDIEGIALEIIELARRRTIIFICDEMQRTAFDVNEGRTDDIIDDAEQALLELRQGRPEQRQWMWTEETIPLTLEQINKARKHSGLIGVTTGLKDLDELIGGWRENRLYILGGRPGMGKSILGGHFAQAAARPYDMENDIPGLSVGVFSIEMDKDELNERFIAAEGARHDFKATYHNMQRGRIDDDQFRRMQEYGYNVTKMPISVLDEPGIRLAEIRLQTKRLKRDALKKKTPLGLIVIDYLQLITADDRYAGNRVQEVSEFSRGLKRLAREERLPVLCLAQLSREVEKRDKKRPQMSDLRESGTIEQDADVVMFCYRKSEYMKKDAPREGDPNYVDWKEAFDKCSNIVEILTPKQRGGPTGNKDFYIDPATARVGDLAK